MKLRNRPTLHDSNTTPSHYGILRIVFPRRRPPPTIARTNIPWWNGSRRYMVAGDENSRHGAQSLDGPGDGRTSELVLGHF
jgi:hypothetical protein